MHAQASEQEVNESCVNSTDLCIIYKYLIFKKCMCIVFCDRDFEIETSLLYRLTQPSLSLLLDLQFLHIVSPSHPHIQPPHPLMLIIIA